MNQISTIQQLQSQVSTTYIMAVICAIACVLLSIGIASLIPYKGGQKDRSFVKRRIWYILLSFIGMVTFFLPNYFVVLDKIKNPALQSKYINGLGISTGIFVTIYIVLGIVLMLILKKSKYGSILNRKNKN